MASQARIIFTTTWAHVPQPPQRTVPLICLPCHFHGLPFDSILFEIFSLSSTLGHHEQFQPAVTPLMRDMEIFTAGHQ